MEIGQTLNQRYTLTTRLGKGAMGIVYRASDLQTGQDVAIKVIARELALDDDMLERFRREGEALRQLRHPNIVGFVDMFEHEAQHVIVMEYMPGGSLHTLLRQGPLPLERTRRMALELCDALTRAHYLNIIHRDLKPENVLLAADGTPKLTDFGVARLISEGTRLTGTGAQVGTPFYMSPEAWEGKPLDAQTDIWSLGILLYEMLSGRVPFSGDTVAVMNKVLNALSPDLSTLRPDVSPGLAQIVERMLARDKAERYQSMRELAADLERGEPLTMVADKLRSGAAKHTRAKARPNVAPAAKTQATSSAGRRPLWPWLVGGVVILAALALGGLGLGAGWLIFGKGAVSTPAQPTASSVPIPSGAPTRVEPATTATMLATPTTGAASAAAPPISPRTVTSNGKGELIVKAQDGSASQTLSASTVETGTQFIAGNIYWLDPAWSPDGTKIIFEAQPSAPGPNIFPDLYVVSADGRQVTRLTNTPDTHEGAPAWSPDGQSIAFIRQSSVYVMKADGTQPQKIYNVDGRPNWAMWPVWSPDSTRIAFGLTRAAQDTPEVKGPFDYQLLVITHDGSALQTIYTSEPLAIQSNWRLYWSPDGKSIGYLDENGVKAFVLPADGSAPPRETTEDIQTWSPQFWPPWGHPSAAATPSSANRTLKVGLLLPLSGPNAAYGASARDGAQMAVDEWNTQGGLLGGMILPILADGQCNADPAVAAANRLFDQEGVRYLIGELCSKASIPVSAIAESRGVVEISPASTDPRVTLNDNGSPKAYVFRAAFVDTFQGTVMANFALGQKLQRAFVIYDQDNPYSSGLAKYFMVAFEKAGGKIVGAEAYTIQTTDFAAILDRVAASQAQVLFVPDFSGRVNLIAQQAKQKGLQAVLMGGDGWEGGDLDLGALDGGYYSTGYSALAPQAGAPGWAERYHARYNRAPDAMAALAYDAANLLFTAIRQTGIDDPPRVKDVLAGLQFEGVTGKIAFDAQHNPVKSAVIMQIKDGQRVYAATVEAVP